MALIKASYTVNRSKAYAGMIADTSLYNINGTCAAQSDLLIGKLVAVQEVEPVDGHIVVDVATDGTKPLLGIAVMSHAYSPTGVYEAGCATNVMTHGRVWALAEKTLTEVQAAFGGYVDFNASGVVSNGGAVKTGYKFTGEILDTDSPDYKIVKIQVLEGAVAPAEPAGGGA